MEMNSIIGKVWLGVMLATLVAGCSVTTNIPKPNESYKLTDLGTSVSTVAIPVSFNRAQLLASINQRLDGLIYEDNDNSDDNLLVKVWKIQPITATFSGNAVSYTVPIKVWVNASVGMLGYSISSDLDGELAMTFTTTFTFSKDWSMVPKTTMTSYTWLSDPKARVGKFQLPASYIADKAMSRAKQDICKKIDENFGEGISLTAVVDQLTTFVKKPILVNPDYNIWLVLVPQKVSISPFSSTDSYVSTTIGLQTISEVVIDKQSPDLWLDAPKPQLVVGNSSDRYVNINFGVDVPFEEAERLFSKAVVGKKFSQGHRTVRVDSLRIYGSGDKMVIGTQLEGSLNGWIYFKGIPRYNHASSSVEMVNLDYELQTSNILHRTASWLFKSSVLESMRKAMVFPVGEELIKTLAEINQNLIRNRNIPNLELNGKITELAIDQIDLIPDAFRVKVKAKGEVAVEVKRIQ
mgnify:CR=1 FL=1|jgi:hypothetical protein